MHSDSLPYILFLLRRCVSCLSAILVGRHRSLLAGGRIFSTLFEDEQRRELFWATQRVSLFFTFHASLIYLEWDGIKRLELLLPKEKSVLQGLSLAAILEYDKWSEMRNIKALSVL